MALPSPRKRGEGRKERRRLQLSPRPTKWGEGRPGQQAGVRGIAAPLMVVFPAARCGRLVSLQEFKKFCFCKNNPRREVPHGGQERGHTRIQSYHRTRSLKSGGKQIHNVQHRGRKSRAC